MAGLFRLTHNSKKGRRQRIDSQASLFDRKPYVALRLGSFVKRPMIIFVASLLLICAGVVFLWSKASTPVISAPENSAATAQKSNPTQKSEAPKVSATPKELLVPVAGNPSALSVVEAAKTKSHPERLSYMVMPKKFDKAAYDANPTAYLNTVEPGRVRQMLDQGKGVPYLQEHGSTSFTIKPGASAGLSVVAIPNAPVTYVSFDGGSFENRMNCITVKADAEGVATANFIATKSVTGDVNILAASPLTSDQISFYVRVQR
jgi:hypothetical protein